MEKYRKSSKFLSKQLFQVLIILISIFANTEKVSAALLTVQNINDSGIGSLRNNIETSNDGDSIIFDKSLNNKTINILTEIPITKSIAINGSNITLSGRELNSIFYINTGTVNLRLYNLTFIQAPLSNVRNGSLIYNMTSNYLYANNCVFENSNKNGSIVYLGLGAKSNIIQNCTFKNNKSISIVSNSLYSLNIIGSEFNNTGVINVTEGLSNFTNCTFKNGAKAIAVLTNDKFTIKDCYFLNNTITTETKESSLIYSYTSAEIIGCNFSGNIGRCITYYHSINGSNHYFNVTKCSFDNNNGGGISFSGKDISGSYSERKNTLNVSECLFTNNSGTAISASKNVNISDCTFKNNNSPNMGAAISGYGESKNDFVISRCTFVNNTSANRGGAIAWKFGSIDNSTFSGNSSILGGAIASFSDETQTYSQIRFCTFYKNNSTSGGAIYNYATMAGNLFYKNYMIPDNKLNDVGGSQISSENYNVFSADQSSVFSKTNDVRYEGSDSILLKLKFYGGLTETMPINTAVSNWENIIRRVPKVLIPRTTDQRGKPINSTFTCAGALEVGAGETFTALTNDKVNEIKAYPNPTRDYFNIFGIQSGSVMITDLNGKMIILQELNAINKIDLQNVPSGVYFYMIVSPDGIQNGKIIKE
jgi:predicted outer membrane repeat protein